LPEQKQNLAPPKLIVKEDSASNQVLKNLFSNAGLWESEDSVSLDPRSCPPACGLTGISRFLYLPIWEDYSKTMKRLRTPRSNLEKGQKKHEGLALIHKGLADRLAPGEFLCCAACSFDIGAICNSNITQEAMGYFSGNCFLGLCIDGVEYLVERETRYSCLNDRVCRILPYRLYLVK
jgi:hypothetical protein